MAGIKLNTLPSATVVQDDDYLMIEQREGTKKTKVSDINKKTNDLVKSLDTKVVETEKSITTLSSQMEEKANLNIVTNLTKQLIYNKQIGLMKWKNELELLKTTNKILNLNVIGTSIACGGVATDYRNKGWVGLLRKMFETKYENVGGGMIPVYQKNTGDVDMWTYTGTWTNETLFGIMGNSKNSTVLNSTATLNFKGTGIKVLMYCNTLGGKFSIQVDSQTPIEFTSYLSSANPCKEFGLTGLTDTSHILTIKQLEEGKNCLLIGAYETNGNKGVRINGNCLFGGAVMNSIVNNNVLTAEIDYWSPTLTIIEFCTNDYQGQVPIDTFKTRMQTLITRAKTFGDVLLLPNGIREETKTITQVQYIQALKELALLNNIVFMDTYDKFGGDFNYAKNILSYIYDTVHPNDVGHENIANWVADVIL